MESLLINFENISIIIDTLKTFFITICTFYTYFKLINIKIKVNIKTIIAHIFIIAIAFFSEFMKYNFNFFLYLVCMILLESVLCSVLQKEKLGYTIVGIVIALSINYIIFVVAVLINFMINLVIMISSDEINLMIIIIIHIILLVYILHIKKINKGIAFLNKNNKDEYMDMIILNISTIIIFSIIILSNFNFAISKNLFVCFIVFVAMLFITIPKSLQLYYKQKLLVQELNETKEELENAKKELKQVEEENLNFSKKSHTLAHRQKSLEHKIQELEAKAEITVEEAGEVKDKLKEIEKDLYKEPAIVELRKTEISQIDDMLKYMQSECIENKINFELQLSGNIHYMVNNLISKDDLEILLADHIKDAIIAINHTDNINRSILVKLGEIEGIYSLYIYDSGIEFETETLENLGKKPSTTHADEGGTGMGFMNTFDTLRKYEASLIINELSKPNKDNYTKVLIFKFDKKNEFKIVSYRQSQPR